MEKGQPNRDYRGSEIILLSRFRNRVLYQIVMEEE